jgi:hypothetical protein
MMRPMIDRTMQTAVAIVPGAGVPGRVVEAVDFVTVGHGILADEIAAAVKVDSAEGTVALSVAAVVGGGVTAGAAMSADQVRAAM